MKGVTRTFLVEEFKLHWTVLHCPWNTYTINLISVIINIENKEIFTEDWIGMSFLFIETKGFQLLHTFATLGSVWKEFYKKKTLHLNMKWIIWIEKKPFYRKSCKQAVNRIYVSLDKTHVEYISRVSTNRISEDFWRHKE